MMRRLAIGLIGVLLAGVAATAFAQPKAAPGATASFHVQVIQASKADKPHLDKRLEAMNRHLRPFKGQYNRFVLLTARDFKLTAGSSGTVTLPGVKKTFAVQFTGFTGGKVKRVRYTVQMPHTRMKRSVAPGGQTLDVVRDGPKLTIVSTLVR